MWLIVIGICSAASAAFWWAIGLRMHRLRRAVLYLDSTTPETPADDWPRVSMLIPARNEERDIVRTLEAALAVDYPRLDWRVIDDESTDGTVARVEEVFRNRPEARLLRGAKRPDAGWVGKSWALTQGVAATRSEWLLFIDADVVLHPSALKQAMGEARRLGVDALSIMPSIECRTVWDRIIMPLFAILSALMKPMHKVNHPEHRDSRFSGAFILIRREAYDAVGGHAALRTEILEDMALARALKEADRPIRLLYTHDLLRTRMYDHWRDLWQGLTRFAYPMLKYSLPLLAVAYLAAFFGIFVPWLALLLGAAEVALDFRNAIGGWLLGAGAVLLAGQAFVLKDFFRVLRIHPRALFWLPLGTLVMCLAAAYSAYRHYSGGGLHWKGRVYGGS